MPVVPTAGRAFVSGVVARPLILPCSTQSRRSRWTARRGWSATIRATALPTWTMAIVPPSTTVKVTTRPTTTTLRALPRLQTRWQLCATTLLASLCRVAAAPLPARASGTQRRCPTAPRHRRRRRRRRRRCPRTSRRRTAHAALAHWRSQRRAAKRRSCRRAPRTFSTTCTSRRWPTWRRTMPCSARRWATCTLRIGTLSGASSLRCLRFPPSFCVRVFAWRSQNAGRIDTHDGPYVYQPRIHWGSVSAV
jgi:hypothetical protein